MEVFTSGQTKPVGTQVFTLPVKRPEFKLSPTIQNKEKALYPLLSGMSAEEVQTHSDAGIMGPVITQTELKSTQKDTEVVQKLIQDQPDLGEAVTELEAARNSNPFLKQFISPATVAALKQSDNPLARRAAQTKVANVAIAVELMQVKSDEANAEGFLTNIDFVDAVFSDLPIVSSINVEQRKDLANRFVRILDSSEDPALVKQQLSSILDEAADQGFFTKSNRFYLQDFLNLVSEGTQSGEAIFQETLGAFDTTIGLASVLGDAARLLAFTRRGKDAVKDTLMDAVRKDDPVAGHSDPSNLSEGLGTPSYMRPSGRLPDEATAVLEINLETKAMQDAISIRQASGQSIDDEAFETFRVELADKAKAQAEKTGLKRYIDADVVRDDFENVALVESFGTTKGRAYTSEIAANKAAAQMPGAVVVPVQKGPGIQPNKNLDWNTYKSGETLTLFRGEGGTSGSIKDGNWWTTDLEKAKKYGKVKSLTVKIEEVAKYAVTGHGGPDEMFFPNGVPTAVKGGIKDFTGFGSPGNEFVIKKATNLPTGMFYSGRTPNDIFKELQLYRTTNSDELGEGMLTKYIYSPLSQTTDNLNAILKQGEAARAKASAVLDKTYQPLVKSVGSDGVKAVNNVLTDIREGSRASLRKWPTQAEFDTAFVELNKRMPTAKEKELYAATVHRSDVDWYLSADMHFKREVNKGVEVFIQDGLELPGIKASEETYSDAMAWNADAKKYTKVSDLPEDAQLLRLAEPTEFDGKLHDLIATVNPKSRALKHTDVMGYNPGGSRLYQNNRTNFIIKQNQEVSMADGRIFTGRPTTIMVAKTLEESKKATQAINSIIEEVHKVNNPRGVTLGPAAKPIKTGEFAYTKDEFYRAVAAQENNKDLNKFIAEVSDWNPNVHSVKTLVEFFEEMGLDLRKAVDWTEDGKPLVNGDTFVGDLSFKDVMTSPGILKRGNVRRDKALIGYGGSAVPTVPPLEAIQKTFMGSIARSTQAAYEAASINGLLKGLLQGIDGKPLVAAQTLEDIRYLTLRQKLKALDGKIFTGTTEGKKFELERQKILYRLEQQNFLDAAYIRGKDRLANAIYDKGFDKIAGGVDALSVEPFAAMRGIVFDSYLGMFAPDQLWVQASQITNVVALSSGYNGIRAVAAMPIVRKLIMNGHPAPTKAMAERMGPLLGMSPEHFVSMVDELKKNGRISVAASLADLGEDSAGKVAFRRFREAGRTFYNEGELAARITAHISASLEYVKKFGDKADLTTNSARKYISHQSDLFTNAMTSTSRTGIEQLPMMQFMSYSMRMGEYLLGGLMGGKSVLSTKQKVRLFGVQLGLYGASAVPFAGYYLDWFNFKHGTGLEQNDYITIRHGVLDALVEYMTGVESELGRRLAWGEGMYNTIADLGTDNIAETLLGPTASLASDVISATSRLAFNLKTGGTDLLAEDIVDVFRSIKSVNLGYNAYMAFRYGEYQTKSGRTITGDIDGAEAAAIAMGIPLTDVNNVWRNLDMLKKDKKYYQDRAKKITSVWQDLTWEYKNNGHSTQRADILRKQLEVIYAMEGLDPYDIQQIERYVDKSVISLNEQVIIDIMRTDAAAREQVTE